MTKPKNVLILGCGRSGTSIFGELFKHLSAYQYYSEPPFADLLTLNYDLPLAVKVPKESPEYLPTPGLSFPLDTFFEVVPGQTRVFWLVRHPLDTICSLKVGISRNWGHHPRPEDWQDWLSRSLVEQCAHHWNYINSVSFSIVENITSLVKFEDMIADPQVFAERVCEQTGLNKVRYHDEIETWAQRVQNTNNKDFVEAETSREYSTNDHQSRVGRWKENMTEEEVQQVLPIIADTAKKMDYAL